MKDGKQHHKPVENKTLYVFSLCGQLGIIIAIPAVVLIYSGQLLDKKFSTSPWFILTGLFLAMIISGLIIWRLIKKIEEK